MANTEHLSSLAQVADTSERVAATPRRSEKVALLADCLRRLPSEWVAVGTAYLSGNLPQGRIGVGQALLQTLQHVDPAVAPSLSLHDVDAALTDVAQTRGAGVGAGRRAILSAIFQRATRVEQAFLARLLAGELRQGALEAIMGDAIAQAAGLNARDVRRAIMLAGNVIPVAQAALTEGAPGLERYRLEPLRPVQPMLSQAAVDVGDALRQLGHACLEYKLDGARIQVHKRGAEVRIYTRSLNDVTAALPDIVEAVACLPAHSLILDGEGLALRPDGTPHAFQTTMRRFGRKLEVDALRAELPLSAFFFDCLYLEGASLIDRPTRERIAALDGALPPSLIMPRLVTADLPEAEAFLSRALGLGHEGIMAKALDAPYEAGNRGATWLKVKHAHTLDLVVLAAEWGSGRRRGWLSNLHLGARDPEHGGFVMLGKTFKGMTDAILAWQTQRLEALAVAREDHVVHVRPELVVEVAFNDIQASPHYPGGLALRFARLKRYREDKRPDDADTIDTLRTLYARQRNGAV